MGRLLAWNRLRWYWRLPVKWVIFGVTLLAVCFPYPSRLVDHVRHWRDPNALIEPDAPALKPWVEELRPILADSPSAKETLERVERYVYEKVPYDWDWNTWGTADYLPTLSEVLEAGREDCDGRAVVAASLLWNFGFEAQIVTDLAHVWVKTDQGETMGPGKEKAVVATEDGLQIRTAALKEAPRALAYGSAVFPLARELIVLAVAWVLLLRSDGRVAVSAIGLALLVGALFLLREGGQAYRHPILWMQWAACGCMVAALVLLLMFAKRRTQRVAGA